MYQSQVTHNLMVNSTHDDISCIGIDVSPEKINPWVIASHDHTRLICGFDIGRTDVRILFNDINGLIKLCESLGISINGLLEDLERARYQLAA